MRPGEDPLNILTPPHAHVFCIYWVDSVQTFENIGHEKQIYIQKTNMTGSLYGKNKQGMWLKNNTKHKHHENPQTRMHHAHERIEPTVTNPNATSIACHMTYI